MLNLDLLKELNKKRTAGPWHIDGKEDSHFAFLETTKEEAPIQFGHSGCLEISDATFITALVNSFDDLVKAAEAGRVLVEKFENFGHNGCFVCKDSEGDCDCDPDRSDKIERDAALSAYRKALE